MAVKPIPEGYHSVTPALTCRDAAQAIEFYKKAFGAREVMRMPSPDGNIMHAELKIGDSTLFLGDEFPGMSVAPSASSLPSSSLFLYVPDAAGRPSNQMEIPATTSLPCPRFASRDSISALGLT